MRFDALYLNGRFHTQDPLQPEAEALATLGGRVVALGDRSLADVVQARRVVDLGGRHVVPGFNDAHNHLLFHGVNLDDVDLGSPPMRSVADICRAIAERAAATPPGEWVIGAGYDQNKLIEARHPTAAELDAVAPRHRVWLSTTPGTCAR